MARKRKSIGARSRGNLSVFRNKSGDRYQGVVTATGARHFERARGRLARLVDAAPEAISDGDTIEYLARGETDTIRYLEQDK